MSGPAPLVSVVIPTHGRASSLPRAVRCVLASTVDDLEVLVVDDASPAPADPGTDDPRVRVIRLPVNVGNAGARAAGVEAARGRWLAFCDDDDTWLPHLLAVSLDAAAASTLPPPVAVISGIAVVDDESGRVLSVREPARFVRGEHFFLEGRGGHLTKQTLVIEREVLAAAGGFDPSFRSRVWTDLFLRVNAMCSIEAAPVVTYELREHAGPRVSGDPALRRESLDRLLDVHRSAFAGRPTGAARFLVDHGAASWRAGLRVEAARALVLALGRRPVAALRHAAGTWRGRRRLARSAPAPEPVRPAGRITLLATSPLRWESGYDDLLVALAAANARGADATLRVEGAGTLDDVQRFLFTVFDLELDDRVTLAGSTAPVRFDALVIPAVAPVPAPDPGDLVRAGTVVATPAGARSLTPSVVRTEVPAHEPEALARALAAIGDSAGGRRCA